MLDRHPDLESVGEIDFLDYWRDRNLLCSCSVPVRECRYWGEVLPKVEGDGPLRIGSIPRARSLSTVFRAPSVEQAREYSLPTYRLFKAVLEHRGKGYVVDSSKRFPRLLHLQRSGLFDLHVIHLVRNGNAVVNSYRKPVSRAGYGNDEMLRPGSALYTSARWLAYNLKAEQVGRTLGPSRFVQVRYEDLAADPPAALRRICDTFGLSFDESMAAPSTRDIHNICGSRWRFTAGDTLQVKVDERWRGEIRPLDRAVFSVVGGALNRRYGYGR
jgi:hypothetical protein